MSHREPIFNVPWPVFAVLAVFAAVHGVRQVMTPEDANWFVLALAFIPARYVPSIIDIPAGPWADVTSFVTHIFTHADATHLVINSAWLLAFGSVLSRRMGALRFLTFFILGGIAGAVAFLAMHFGEAIPVVGASGAIAAMMGGVMRFLFVAIDNRQGYLLRERPDVIPRMPLVQSLLDRRIVVASLLFVGINLLALIGFGSLGSGTIAWEAHLGGYAFGLLAFGFFDDAPQHVSPTQTEVE